MEPQPQQQQTPQQEIVEDDAGEAAEVRRRRSRVDDKEGNASKKKNKSQPDPFTIPKHNYDRKAFEHANPFVRVIEVPEREELEDVADRVSDGRAVDPLVLNAAGAVIRRHVYSATRFFRSPQSEPAGRPIHAAYLEALHFCTRPRSNLKRRLPELPELSEDESGDEQCENTIQHDESEEDDEDIVAKAGGMVAVSDDVASQISTTDESLYENDGLNLRDAATYGASYDFKVKTYDKRINAEVTVLIVECEWDKLSLNKTYQGAGYGIKAALKNMKKGRFGPVFLHTWGESFWRYGVLFPRSIVDVHEGRVVRKSGLRRGGTRKHLRSMTGSLLRHYGIAEYPSNEYVAGDLLIFQKKFPFNFTKFQWDSNARLFIQALLRMVVGDRVLTWTMEDFRKVYNARVEACLEEEAICNLSDFAPGAPMLSA